MNRFYLFSTVLHVAIFGIVLYINRDTMKPMPEIEVYKVSIAPLPQPKVIAEEAVEEEIFEEMVKEIPKEKAPPREDTPKPPEKKTVKQEKTEVIKKGLPDITPKIYTGSGRGFTYSYYLNILLNKISKNWHNPFKGKDVVLKSIVYFEVDKDGLIYSVRLEEKSGDAIYDETTMRAVTMAKKLPRLPQEFSDDYLKVHLEFLTAQ
ncbi:MAG: TonB C-terminal domain-containing protein [candidate division WOR-3 bacterium]|nr:MAG: TonB C-terminal domain-containing protein [candidate division WOR-3 bacterium]